MRLAELLCPLAAAADAGAALPPDTSYRAALIALALAKTLEMPAASYSALMYAGLLRHLGCSATAHEETQLMGDEQELRASLNTVDAASPRELLLGASRGFARKRSRVARARVVAGFMLRAPRAVPRIFQARCEVSARLARRLGLSEDSVCALEETYERYDGKGQPNQRRGADLSPLSSVLAVAEWIAMFIPLPGGEALAFQILQTRTGSQFDPKVVAALAGARDSVLQEARSATPLGLLLAAEPKPWRQVHDARAVAQVLADFVDLKSTFTLGHSRKVAELSVNAAKHLALPAAEVEALELAAWVHDLGRVSVSNAIWDKPGPLDAGEWMKVHAHPQFTERVLGAAGPFAAVARLAASDHERMDGAGYPRGAVPTGAARILAAADTYQALIESRAYRPAHTPDGAAKVLVEESLAGRLDRAAVNAVLVASGQRPQRFPATRGLTERELEVLRLLASGMVDKDIAARMGVSPRTVQHHDQSIFSKLQVSTRGAAALFAIEHGLV